MSARHHPNSLAPTFALVLALALSPLACDAPAQSPDAPSPEPASAPADPTKGDGAPSEDPKVSTVSEAAVAPTQPPPPEPPPPEPQPLEEKSVLIIGSSLAATGFGALLEDRLDAHPFIEAHRKAKSATGLARPDFYDWEAEGAKQIEALQPDLTLVILGANDGQDLTPRANERRVIWKSEGWREGYLGRVQGLLDVLMAGEGEVLWLGLPRTNTHNLEAKLKLIRAVHREAVDAQLGASYLDLTPFVENEAGDLLKLVEVRGKRQTLRGEDGVHFTMSGSRYLADAVYPGVLEVLGLPDPSEQPNPDAPATPPPDAPATPPPAAPATPPPAAPATPPPSE